MADPVDRFRDGLPEQLVPLSDQLGWVCPACKGRMLLPDAPADTNALDRAVDLLLDAATSHRC